MRRSINWVALAVLAALCSATPRVPPGIQFGAEVAAESPVGNDPSASFSPPVGAPPTVSSQADATALVEMLHDSTGQRQLWKSVPDLVVLSSVMQYHAGEASEYVATSEQVNAEDTKSLVADLTFALRLLTNNTFEQFATIQYEAVPEGSSITIVRPKQIVVGRYRGLRELAQTIGFGGRKARRDGAIIGATIVLDSEFDRTSKMRRLLRTHELGHALGFNHVKSRLSIMNPRIGAEVTEFDRQIAMLAFLRPGSRPTE
jgi:hypothetical protein